MKKIAVFFGGKSLEHDVSVITGVLTLNSLDKIKYDPVPVFVDRDGAFYTGNALFDVGFFKEKDFKKLQKIVFLSGGNTLYALKKNKLKPLFKVSAAINCMHGENGEDGTLAGFLRTCSIPLASPDLFSSAACMDKGYSKTVLKGLGVPTLSYAVLTSAGGDVMKKVKGLTFPLVIKPCSAGSSIGIGVAETKEELEFAVSNAFKYCGRVIVEPFLRGATEINCAAFAGKDGEIFVSPCERPIGSGDILSFDDKYLSGKREFPAKIDKKLSEKIRRLTEKIYLGLGAFGVIRVDYLVADGKVFVCEINTVPGSLAYYLFCDNTAEFSDMLTEIITGAEKKFSRESTEIKTFDSGVLSELGSKGAKRL